MKKQALLFLFQIVVVIAFAQPKQLRTFTLQEAVDFALKNNVAAKNALLSEKEAKARNNEIISFGLPQISANFDYSYYFKQPTSPAIAKLFGDTTSASAKAFDYLSKQYPLTGTSGLLYQIASANYANRNKAVSFVLPHNISTGIQVSQILFDPKYVIGLKATKDFTLTSKLSTKLAEKDIRYNVTKAYYQVLAAQQSKGLMKENLIALQKLVNDTRKIFAEGLVEELDVNRLELAEANLQTQVNLVNQQADIALSNLKFNMGLVLWEEIALTDKLDDLKNKLPKQIVNNFDPSQRTEYKLLETAIRIRKYDMQQRRSGNFPALYGFLNYGGGSQVQSFKDFFRKTETSYLDPKSIETAASPNDFKYETVSSSNWFQQGLVGFSLKVPIFDGGQRIASTQQAKMEMEKTKNDFENFKNAALLQAEVAQTSCNAALADEINSQKTKELSAKIYKTNQIKYKEGLGSSFELTQSETEYITNQLRYIQSILNLLSAKAELDKVLEAK
jgi:outer membrane protein TolC